PMRTLPLMAAAVGGCRHGESFAAVLVCAAGLVVAPEPARAACDVIAIATGYNHSLALLRDGTLRAWGGNEWGMLGDGTHVSRPLPVAVTGVTGLSRVVAVSSGGLHSLALDAD